MSKKWPVFWNICFRIWYIYVRIFVWYMVFKEGPRALLLPKQSYRPYVCTIGCAILPKASGWLLQNSVTRRTMISDGLKTTLKWLFALSEPFVVNIMGLVREHRFLDFWQYHTPYCSVCCFESVEGEPINQFASSLTERGKKPFEIRCS